MGRLRVQDASFTVWRLGLHMPGADFMNLSTTNCDQEADRLRRVQEEAAGANWSACGAPT